MDNRIHRLYFGIRYLIGGLITNAIVLSYIAIRGKINFTQAIIVIPIAIIIALVSCTKMNKKMIELSYQASIKLKKHPNIEKFIFKLV